LFALTKDWYFTEFFRRARIKNVPISLSFAMRIDWELTEFLRIERTKM
jgi:hypothetical protein